jgi:ADP-ribose pyrophosphatase YjhB (NUDIX family)
MKIKRIIEAGAIGGFSALAITLIFIGLRGGGSEAQYRCEDTPSSAVMSLRSQGILIQDRKVLALRLEKEKNYSLPGGQVSGRETSESALKRELKEEVGIDINTKDLEYYKTDCIKNGEGLQQLNYFIVKKWSGDLQFGSDRDRFKWVNFDYEKSKKADADLKLALFYLKGDNLVD